jgi:cytochrome c-type biogenesis protein CcmH
MKLVALLAVLIFAAVPRASLPDIEDEVMCVECGTVLSVSNSPVAEQERAFIRQEIAQGKNKQQIKAALVEQYGEEVLADPGTGGFNKTLWIVPIVLVLVAVGGIGFAVKRWKGRPVREEELPPPLSPEDAARLDAELLR